MLRARVSDRGGHRILHRRVVEPTLLVHLDRKLPALRAHDRRAAAIATAIAHAGPDDTVLITGKGHEDYQVVADPPGVFGGNTRKVHFDDREQAVAALSDWVPPGVTC